MPMAHRPTQVIATDCCFSCTKVHAPNVAKPKLNARYNIWLYCTLKKHVHKWTTRVPMRFGKRYNFQENRRTRTFQAKKVQQSLLAVSAPTPQLIWPHEFHIDCSAVSFWTLDFEVVTAKHDPVNVPTNVITSPTPYAWTKKARPGLRVHVSEREHLPPQTHCQLSNMQSYHGISQFHFSVGTFWDHTNRRWPGVCPECRRDTPMQKIFTGTVDHTGCACYHFWDFETFEMRLDEMSALASII